MASIIRRGCPPILAALLVAVPLVMGAGAAHAGRPRLVPEARIGSNPPTPVPEPAAAIVFGLGVGLVAWKSRRSLPSA